MAKRGNLRAGGFTELGGASRDGELDPPQADSDGRVLVIELGQGWALVADAGGAAYRGLLEAAAPTLPGGAPVRLRGAVCAAGDRGEVERLRETVCWRCREW